MSASKLSLEILSGPLDGHVVTLSTKTVLSRCGEGALVFPFDTELGEPQAIFLPEGDRRPDPP